MEVIAAVAAWAVGSACRGLSPGADSWVASFCPAGAANTNANNNHAAALARQLSAGATILAPGSDGWDAATLRWSAYEKPGLELLVTPSTAEDVAQTVSSRLPPPSLSLGPWRSSRRSPE